MPWLPRLAVVVVGLIAANTPPVSAETVDSLYQSQTIVTGQGEVNRQIGFKTCLDAVLVRVSGDQRLAKKPEMAALRDKAGSFVAEFRYHDRLEGIPVHDEQGTHDRPHDLTCLYKPDAIDPVLAALGSKPWLAERPRLAIFLAAEQGTRQFALTADDQRGAAMRESFVNATGPLVMRIVFPKRRCCRPRSLTTGPCAMPIWRRWTSLPERPVPIRRSPAAWSGATRSWAGSPIGGLP